ncbi:MAG: hypothetical protein JO301_08885 [Chitinophagaceae bacterium]|nr:hypothetical protein [Chitinophagaceae bacterium]
MRLIDRLQEYLAYYQVSAYAFEHTCGLSNGYLGKQLKGKGAVGSDILERIKQNYTDLSLVWLVTGRGTMLLSPPSQNGTEKKVSELNEEQHIYFTSKDDVIKLLKKQIEKLESTIADKDRIIALLELQVRQMGQSAYKRSR